ncbi:cyclin-like protein [Radiomyces spectabilis]|uniref:cyclin-like protein n=1 Tax=Radiomyces spectabilis TaxID=64574 RepID=UPI00221E44D2|nr:cyclin-like protein [Radiomyces spectabilis]KAI8371354.1 cyclin-like protein [Radiomyces spectabilis]
MNQWLFTKDELYQMPSIVNDGMTFEEERLSRLRGCCFIQIIGCRLEVPQVTIATATSYFHRFYARNSFKSYDYEYVAATCVYLAGKVEESSRQLKDVVTACIISRKTHSDEKGKIYAQWQEAILWYEQFLVETLCFDLSVDHPHQLILEFAEEVDAPALVAQYAWAFANDSLRQPLCLIYHPQMVAAACILLGYQTVGVDFPESTDTIWGQTLEQEFELLTAIVSDIAAVYSISDAVEKARKSSSSDHHNSGSSHRNGHAVAPTSNGHRREKEADSRYVRHHT